MRYLVSSDWHVRHTSPAHRIDKYPDTILGKIAFMVYIANQYNAHMLVAGDIFHDVKVKYTYINKLINTLTPCKNKILTVPGQHDMEHHKSDLIHSPYYTLQEAGVITDVSNRVVDGVYGVPWGVQDEIPCTDASIMLIHYCVTDGPPPFFLQGDAKSAKSFLSDNPDYDYIISGDYHTPHKCKVDNRLLINCGSIGRSNTDQVEHKPACYLIDTDKPGKVKRILIPIKESETVFTETAFIEKEDKEDISDQVSEMANMLKDKAQKADYKTAVKMLMKSVKSSKKQMQIARDILRKVS